MWTRNQKIKLLIIALCCTFQFQWVQNGWAYDGNVIMTFGDSITVGYPYLGGAGYAANGCNCGLTQIELQGLLADSHRTSLVLNWGKGGENTAQGVNRISSNIQTTINSWGKVDLVLLWEGTNDYNYGISSSTTAYNLGVMVDKVRAKGARPVMGTLLPGATAVLNYNSAIWAKAQAKGVTIVDHYLAIKGQWASLNYDGVHPNQAGYEFIANVWFNHLTLVIQRDRVAITPMIMLLLDDE